MSVFISLISTVACRGSGLVDNPIVGDVVQYIDSTAAGTKWVATAYTPAKPSPPMPPSSACTFTKNEDWRPNPEHDHSGTMHGNITSEGECCAICISDPDCFVAVWVGEADSLQCWTKTKEDAAGGSFKTKKAGRVSCKPNRSTLSATPAKYTIDARVPGDLITDLQKARLVGDPLFETNFLNSSMWNDYRWVYSTEFALAAGPAADADAGMTYSLVLDGVKMGAEISVNGHLLATVSNQFRRYVLPLSSAVLENASQSSADGGSLHSLTVNFDRALPTPGNRFMSCTGGWDWAFYTNTCSIDDSGAEAPPAAGPKPKANTYGPAQTFTKGIWKSVYIVGTAANSAQIDHVVPQVFYNGAYPTAPLLKGAHGAFTVDVRVFLTSATGAAGTLTVAGGWGSGATKATVPVKMAPNSEGVFVATLHAAAADIDLWWPNGMEEFGRPTLYNVTASFAPSTPTYPIKNAAPPAALVASRRVGFKHFALVTGNDTDPAFVQSAAGKQGTVNPAMTLFWRINGAAIFSKGANMIPMDELEGRLDADAHRVVVESAAAAGLNTLRIWGGGMFLPDAWYDACDELGIMVYHDMQYAQHGHSPTANDDQDSELRHIIRRLSAHTSIVVYDGCNECTVIIGTPTGIYATFVMTIIAEEDKSRSIWPSCPALGWTAGVDMLTSRPLANTNATDRTNSPVLVHALDTPKNGPRIETHGPYQHGTGFGSNNDLDGKWMSFNPNIPIAVPETPAQLGPGYPSVFASEFGCVVMSSFESMSATLEKEHWSLHGGLPADDCSSGMTQTCPLRQCKPAGGSAIHNPMSYRNYPCDSIVMEYFGGKSSDLDAVGEHAFKKQLWQCMMGQALEIKSNIETRRASNTFGITVWQYNEIWPTGGWGSVEYGCANCPGQVIGGRWKPLQYMYKSSVLTDLSVACGNPESSSDAGSTPGPSSASSSTWRCYVKNDKPSQPFTGTVHIDRVLFADGSVTSVLSMPLKMSAGPGVITWFDLPASASLNGTTELLRGQIFAAGDAKPITQQDADSSEPECNNIIALTTPGKMKLPHTTVALKTADSPNSDGSVDITVTSESFALYVTLTTLANGRFSDNAFMLNKDDEVAAGSLQRVIKFIPFNGDVDMPLLSSSIRVEHVAGYM